MPAYVEGRVKQAPERFVATSAADTAQTVSSVARPNSELLAVTVAYSAAILANLDITVTLNAGAGAGYDTRLATVNLVIGQRWAVYIPDVPIPLQADDVVDVLCPTGGAAITSGCQIYIREVTP